jgi:predicted glycosyltransferase
LLAEIKNKTVLISPLNWGLGHASRCIPIIRSLSKENRIIIAAHGNAYTYLCKECPDFKIIPLPDIEIRFSGTIAGYVSLGFKIPYFIRSYYREKKLVAQLVSEEKIDVIISDNRYGVWHPETENYLITHQVTILFPWLGKVLSNISKKLISNFDHCLIPDNAGEDNLSGALSHGDDIPDNCVYIGALSRFKAEESQLQVYDYLAIISGPEPGRSHIEKRVSDFFGRHPEKKCCLIRGVVSSNQKVRVEGNVHVYDFADTRLINQLINQSENIICQSGYSTLMDMKKLNKRAYMFPTKGQTEQEYLYRINKDRFFRCGERLLRE